MNMSYTVANVDCFFDPFIFNTNVTTQDVDVSKHLLKVSEWVSEWYLNGTSAQEKHKYSPRHKCYTEQTASPHYNSTSWDHGAVVTFRLTYIAVWVCQSQTVSFSADCWARIGSLSNLRKIVNSWLILYLWSLNIIQIYHVDITSTFHNNRLGELRPHKHMN